MAAVPGRSYAHLRGTSFQRLHRPAQHLQLTLGECSARASGSGASLVVRHVDDVL